MVHDVKRKGDRSKRANGQLATCVYCLEKKVFSSKNKEFNSDHIVPRSLGESINGNITLIGIVCTSCNKHCGEKLEPILARATWEGFRRYLDGQKPLDKINELDLNRVRFSLENDKDPSMRGLKIEPVTINGELKQQLCSQVCVQLEGSDEWFCVQRDQLKEFAQKTPNVNLSRLHIWGPDAERKDFFEEISVAWPGVKIVGDIPSGEHITDIIVDYGPTERRALAKVAFNYFCWVTQATPEVALDGKFNEIRNFIRYGIPVNWPGVTLVDKPILEGDTVTRRQTNGHLVTYDIERTDADYQVVSHVSLFNDLTWRIAVCAPMENPGDLPPGRIHHWDHVKNVCTEFGRREIPVMMPPTSGIF